MKEVTIGDCRLILGDCLEVMKTLGKVDAVVTDPPYGIGFDYLSYDDSRENLVKLIAGFFLFNDNFNRSVILCGPTQIHLYPEPSWVGAITWNTTGSFGLYGYSQWTPVLLYGKDIGGFGSVNGVIKSDTYHINGSASVGFQRSKTEKAHTCPKPINIMIRMVTRYSLPEEIILDPFMGSGTTGVACAKLGRKFIGIEIEEKYFDIARKRIEEAYKQPDLFIDRPKKAEQIEMETQ